MAQRGAREEHDALAGGEDLSTMGEVQAAFRKHLERSKFGSEAKRVLGPALMLELASACKKDAQAAATLRAGAATENR